MTQKFSYWPNVCPLTCDVATSTWKTNSYASLSIPFSFAVWASFLLIFHSICLPLKTFDSIIPSIRQTNLSHCFEFYVLGQVLASLLTTTMFMLVDCSNCHTPLQLPPGANSIRCVICHAITHIADPRSAPPPPPPYSSSGHHYYPPPPPPAALAPSPYNHAPSGPPPSAHGNKRALICGISYKNTRYQLNGCINDAKCMKYLLVNRFKFPEASIVMLTGTFVIKKKKLCFCVC